MPSRDRFRHPQPLIQMSSVLPASSPRARRSPRPFRLAVVQMSVEPGAWKRNLETARSRIAEAARNGARVVLLPEAADLGWTFPGARRSAAPLRTGAFCRGLRAAAKRHGVYVCGGLTERDGGAVYNAAVLISPTGQVILHHRKLNELEIAHASYDQGDRLGVVATPFGTIGLMICADAYLDGQFVTRSLALMGADVVLSPSAWVVPPTWDNQRRRYGTDWHHNYAAVARPYHLWIAGCSNVGRVRGGAWDGYLCIGSSLVVGPDGRIAARGRFGAEADEIIYCEVTPVRRPARGGGWLSHWKKTR